MNSNEKRWIVLLVAVIVIAIILIVAIAGSKEEKKGKIVENKAEVTINEEKYIVELNDGTKVNTSEELKKVKKYKELEISNIQYTSKNGMTEILADVKNTGNTIHKIEMVKITMLDEKGKEITNIEQVIGEVKPGETIKLNGSITADVVNVKDIKIEEIK